MGLVAWRTRQKNGPDVLLDMQTRGALVVIARLEVFGAGKLATIDFCTHYMFMQTVIEGPQSLSGVVFGRFSEFGGRFRRHKGADGVIGTLVGTTSEPVSTTWARCSMRRARVPTRWGGVRLMRARVRQTWG